MLAPEIRTLSFIMPTSLDGPTDDRPIPG